jgi:hypothetical protein
VRWELLSRVKGTVVSIEVSLRVVRSDPDVYTFVLGWRDSADIVISGSL